MASIAKCYLLIQLLCIFATSYSRSYSDESLIAKHEDWMFQHGRSYKSNEEKSKRFKIFKDNLEFIESFNRAGGNKYKLGINQFADLSKDEFLAKYARSFKPSPRRSPLTSFKYENVKKAVPPSLDWREKNAVTPVQSQGGCGCCWAYSAVAAIEGLVAIKSGKLTPLSEQHILDCNRARDGCPGGHVEHAFDFVSQNGGLASDADYPYQAQQRACKRNTASSLAVKMTGYKYIPRGNETALLVAVANQPITVGIDPIMFQFYHSGILTGTCGKNLTHSITAVGYGRSEDGTKFWTFKNSWGPNWGEQGYIRMQRDIDDKDGMCGLAMYLTYPTA